MRKLLCLLALSAALTACTDDGKLSGDDPTRNNEGPGEGRPMDSNPSMRERSDEVPLSKQRPYASEESTGPEQTTAAPPNPDESSRD
jgi:hypothetical protein